MRWLPPDSNYFPTPIMHGTDTLFAGLFAIMVSRNVLSSRIDQTEWAMHG